MRDSQPAGSSGLLSAGGFCGGGAADGAGGGAAAAAGFCAAMARFLVDGAFFGGSAASLTGDQLSGTHGSLCCMPAVVEWRSARLFASSLLRLCAYVCASASSAVSGAYWRMASRSTAAACSARATRGAPTTWSMSGWSAAFARESRSIASVCNASEASILEEPALTDFRIFFSSSSVSMSTIRNDFASAAASLIPSIITKRRSAWATSGDMAFSSSARAK